LSSDVCLAHLVWEPLGTEPLHRFLQSYSRYSAGVEHRPVILFDGFRPDQDLTPWRRALEHVAHEELSIASPMRDPAAYREAAKLVPTGRYRLWPSSRGFCHDGQENLPVENNQTGAYPDAYAQGRRVLTGCELGSQTDLVGTEHAEVT
jgi:hypothetical protein